MANLVQTPGPATVNQLRENTFGNETELKGEVEQATADIAAHKAADNTDHDGRFSKITDLNAHKASSDHDGRYYSEAEIDAMAVKLTGAQTVAGVKTLTENPVVKNATASTQYQDASGNDTGRTLSVVANTSDRLTRLQVYKPSAGAYVDVLRGYAEDGSADTDLDLYEKGKRVATREYVQDRVRSGFFSVNINQSVTTVAGGETRFPQVLIIPSGARLISAEYVRHIDDHSAAFGNSEAGTTVFTSTGYRYLSAILMHGSNYSGSVFPYIKLQAGTIVSGQLTWTDILTVPAMQEEGITIGEAVIMQLQLGFSV